MSWLRFVLPRAWLGVAACATGCSLSLGVDDYSFAPDDGVPGAGGSNGGSPNMPEDLQGSGGTAPGMIPGNGGAAGEGPVTPNGLDAMGGSGADLPDDPDMPDMPKDPPAPCVQNMTLDRMFQIVQADVARLDTDEALFTRYLTLTNRFNAGVCVDELERERAALTKAINMVSTDNTVTGPVAVDAERTIYRIDLRDYGLNRAVSINGVQFVNRWEAVINGNQYAVPFVGPQADAIVTATQTTVPVLYADAFIATALVGNLYYALIDVDVTQTLDDFVANRLEIDVVLHLEDEETNRAGTAGSRVTREAILVERHDIGIRAGAYWENRLLADAQSAFDDPLGFGSGERMVMFTLPNLLFGFVIADTTGAILEDSDVVIDFNRNDFRARTSLSCSSCHARGLISVVDEVQELALANSIALGLDRDDIESIENIYDPVEFEAKLQDDNATFYVGALERLGLSALNADPVSFVFGRFDLDLTLLDAASDLGVSAEVLRARLGELDQALRALDTTLVDRDDFTSLYRQSLCTLSDSFVNKPDPRFCPIAP